MEISAKNLSKTYGNKQVVKGINIEIKKGKILGLLGPNGAGKSTTIKMLTGQIRPTSGDIFVDGKKHSYLPENLRNKIGIMPQEIIIWDDLSILENLNFTANLFKLDSKAKKKRVEDLIHNLKLKPEINTFARNLSGGYKRRLNLAISILHDPEIIFLDEPTPGIDAQSRILLTDYIEKLAKTGNYSIVLTDHYLEEAEKLSDYVVIIDNGEVIAEGTVPELKAKHGNGNLLQIHLASKENAEVSNLINSLEKEFGEITVNKDTISILIEEIEKSINNAIQIINKSKVQIHNISIKEPSLEDVFLILTGKDVRE